MMKKHENLLSGIIKKMLQIFKPMGHSFSTFIEAMIRG
jgi:hypothetical protein